MNNPEKLRLSLLPFEIESAIPKVQIAEDVWNTRNPKPVALAYTSNKGVY